MADLPKITDDPQVMFALRRLKASFERIEGMGETLTDIEQLCWGGIHTVMGEFLSRSSGLFEGNVQSIDDLYRQMRAESSFGGPIDGLRRGSRYVYGEEGAEGRHEPVTLDFIHTEGAIPLHNDFVLVLNDLIKTRNQVDAGEISNDRAAFDKGYRLAKFLGLDTSGYDLSEGLAASLLDGCEDDVIIIPSGPDGFEQEVGPEFTKTLRALQQLNHDATVYEPGMDADKAASDAELMRFGIQAMEMVQKRLDGGHALPPARLRMAMLAGGQNSDLVTGLGTEDNRIKPISTAAAAIAAVAATQPDKARRMADLARQMLVKGNAI